MPTPSPILIAAINARHSHTSLGARCLLANMGELRAKTELLEFTIQQTAGEIAARIHLHAPQILGLGVYIWNAQLVDQLLPLLRQKMPALQIILGGPEIQTDTHPHADFCIIGDGDLAFAALCRKHLSIAAPAPAPALQLPYDEYTATDLAHRQLYVESSRGCAMHCDYCTSAHDTGLHFFSMPELLTAFDSLLERGGRHFKFCDRSFNLNIPHALEILEFFIERQKKIPDIFLHFEMLPDRFPPELREIFSRFPPRSLQLELGIQSFNPDVLKTVRRMQNLALADESLRFLRTHTSAWLHSDLIAGLPGETPDSFAAGFDQLVACNPHEIQLGILKKLPGAPIARHDDAFAMRYNPAPPYEILSTRDWPAEHLMRTARFAHYWDAFVNSQRFIPAAHLIWNSEPSAFDAFMKFSDWMGAHFPHEHGIPLATLVSALFEFLTRSRGRDPTDTAERLICGYRHTGARDIPVALAAHLRAEPPPPTSGLSKALRRQSLRWSWAENP